MSPHRMAAILIYAILPIYLGLEQAVEFTGLSIVVTKLLTWSFVVQIQIKRCKLCKLIVQITTVCSERLALCTLDLFFLRRFPISKPQLAEQWVRSLGRKNFVPTANSCLCSEHFLPECFRDYNGKQFLREDAVPTIFSQAAREGGEGTKVGSYTNKERKYTYIHNH